MEKFEIRVGWKQVTPMRYARAGLSCEKYRNYIWAAGGQTKDNQLLDYVECYNFKSDQWTEIKKLSYPRAFCFMCVTNDTLYLIGGAAQRLYKDKATTSINCIEVWDIVDLEWKSLPIGLSIPRHGHAVAFLGSQLLIIGGVTTIYMRCLRNVECFCVKRGTWVRGVAALPTRLSGHTAITLPPSNLI